jgi:hypothetical protein
MNDLVFTHLYCVLIARFPKFWKFSAQSILALILSPDPDSFIEANVFPIFGTPVCFPIVREYL